MLCALVCVAGHAACAASVQGVVYVDRNRDRVRQPDEPGLANVVVAHDGEAFAVTDAEGRYRLEVAAAAGIVWARVPAGYRPGPVWRPAGDAIDLGVVPLTADELATPLAFVVGADTHATTSSGPWTGGDLADAIDQAISLAQPPRFFTIVGDVTQGNQSDEFDRFEDAIAGVDVPWVPVPGNHDWYDGGRAWRARWGPDNYSFDVDDVHVVVWDTNLPPDQQLAFFAADLAFVAPGTVVIGLGHDSPTDDVAEQLAAMGVDYLFTGHWHANRRVERTSLIEWGTQTLVMGALDQSPAGYRVVTLVEGTPLVEHRARLVIPQLELTSPHPGSCVSPDGGELLVSAALDAAVPTVTARLDCGPELVLSPRGGWTFGAPLPALAPGAHSVTITAETPSGRRVEKALGFEVCTAMTGARAIADWPQVGGSPEHTGTTAHAIVPPLQQVWATAVGGNVVVGSPVVKDEVVVVSVWDLGSGDQGGLVALDLRTGAIRWRYPTKLQVRNAPAIEGDTVVVALANGEVHAVALGDGSPRWQHDTSIGLDSRQASLWAAPTIADGSVYVAVQGRMSAIDVASGQAVWARDRVTTFPWLGTLAAVAVGSDTAIANYGRRDGMTAWSATAGTPRWELTSDRATAINATPLIDGDTLYVVNSSGTVTALALATGVPMWSTSVTPGSSDWMYSVTAAPALAGGRLLVPTQWHDLVALDTASGAELWRASTPGGALNFAHYRDAEPGFAASPVVTADIVWVPRPDGMLVALAASDGRELWSTHLGAPLVSAPAPAGDYLVVASFDGTVRAMAPAPAVSAGSAVACEPLVEDHDPRAAGCCDARGQGDAAPLVGGAVVLAWRRRRRRR